MGLSKYCFDVDAFAADEFSVAAFLEECRTRNPMETIHQDLRDFQTSLENQVRPQEVPSCRHADLCTDEMTLCCVIVCVCSHALCVGRCVHALIAGGDHQRGLRRVPAAVVQAEGRGRGSLVRALTDPRDPEARRPRAAHARTFAIGRCFTHAICRFSALMLLCVGLLREQNQLQSKIHSQLKTFEDLSKREKDLQLSIRYAVPSSSALTRTMKHNTNAAMPYCVKDIGEAPAAGRAAGDRQSA